MKIMNQYQIRESFLTFFKNKQHAYVPSVPVIAKNDPTLMFINAGMNPFKDIFLGLEKPTTKEACNYQKCIRISGKHNDLEEVGLDSTHHTFFEMLGNWSFGSYYKKEAIAWAWELLTEVWKLPKERLFVTVYREDDESYELWKDISKLPSEKIMRFDEKDNFWEMGEVGPCGPCSEIHYDKGDISTQEDTFSDPIQGVNGENERYVEIWNLVFIQYNRLADKNLQSLPAKYVDTGMGFERIVSILQNKDSNYDTDVFIPLIESLEKITGTSSSQKEYQIPMRVIVDHIRMLCICLADGELPSNEGKGYVLRRVLRRAYRYGRLLQQKEPFLYKLADTFINQMQSIYPELIEHENHIKKILLQEEVNFEKTLDKGITLFNKIIRQEKVQTSKVISGEDAFLLYDTYGFPLDLTLLMATEHHISVDEDTFDKEMQKQKVSSNQKKKLNILLDPVKLKKTIATETQYQGEEKTKMDSEILGLFTLSGNPTSELDTNEEGLLIFDKTPFYSEGGGQIGDRGIIFDENTNLKSSLNQFTVTDTQKIGNIVLHCGKTTKGKIKSEKKYSLQINDTLRKQIRGNHSATHLLHQTLSETLGGHVKQAGSLVNEKKLRFDFYHYETISLSELQKIEQRVNKIIDQGIPTRIQTIPIDEANKLGAKSFFEDKYDDIVRVIAFENTEVSFNSIEFCGGSHVKDTSEILKFKILSEQSISAGIRRIEAISGEIALNYWERCTQIVEFLKEVIPQNMESILPPSTNNESLQKLKNRLRPLKKLETSLNPLMELENALGLFSIPFSEKDLLNKESGIKNISEIQNTFDPILEKIEKKITELESNQKIKSKQIIEELKNIEPLKQNNILFYEKQVNDFPLETIKEYIDIEKNSNEDKIIFVSNIVKNEKIIFICGISSSLTNDFKAGELVKTAAMICEGNGGGKPDFAQAGGKNISQLKNAIEEIKKKIFAL